MGASNWEEHENMCLKYLKGKFGKYADFISLGGSNSTVPDIKVVLKNGKSFWIECKSPKSQSGQFVVIPNEDTFVFSPRNHTSPNEFTDFIIEEMNKNYEKYVNAGTTGVTIDIDIAIFSKWIKNMYSQKGVKFFITGVNDEKFVISSINDFSEYYSIVGKYREKKSGSRDVSRSKQEYLADDMLNENILEEPEFEYGSKMRVKSPSISDKQKIDLNGVRYMFSKSDDEYYTVRVLSNTNNANVIFEISLTKEEGMSDDEFIKILCEM